MGRLNKIRDRRARKFRFMIVLMCSSVVAFYIFFHFVYSVGSDKRLQKPGFYTYQNNLYYLENTGDHPDSNTILEEEQVEDEQTVQTTSLKTNVDASHSDINKQSHQTSINKNKENPEKRKLRKIAHRASNNNSQCSTIFPNEPNSSFENNFCKFYSTMDLPDSKIFDKPYTYRYKSPRFIRLPNKDHSCQDETHIFAGINSGVWRGDRRKAVSTIF